MDVPGIFASPEEYSSLINYFRGLFGIANQLVWMFRVAPERKPETKNKKGGINHDYMHQMFETQPLEEQWLKETGMNADSIGHYY